MVIFDIRKLKNVKDFSKVWKETSMLIPEKGKLEFRKDKGKSSLLMNTLFKVREAFLKLGFDEVINPMIIDESEVYKQYGIEAPVILDRIFYLAGLPRPDIGLDKEKEEILAKENINCEELKKILREYRERKIEADDLTEILKERLNIDTNKVNFILSLFQDFFKLKPVPASLTLRSHMTGAWFITLSKLLKVKKPPLWLFSIDWVFRREQKVDEEHLRYYHSASCVVVDENLSVESAFEITKRILKEIGFENVKIVKKKETARYYSYDKEFEVYVFFKNKWYEIGTFGFYNPISLAKYDIKYPVYNFGLGLERLVQVLYGINDIRNVIFEVKDKMSDEEIASLLKAKYEPKSNYGKTMEEKIKQLILKYKDKVGPFEEVVYEDDKIKITFMEPDDGKKFAGPALLNKIYVKDGNLISSTKNMDGIFIGTYLDFICKEVAYKIESKFDGIYKLRWINGASDINLEIDEVVSNYIHRNKKRIDIKGPVFIDIKIERKS